MKTTIITAAAANPSTFFSAILDIAMQWINAAMDGLIVPFGVGCCGAVFLFLLVKCVTNYRDGHGEEIKDKLFPMLLCLIVAGILLSKNIWWSAFVVG